MKKNYFLLLVLFLCSFGSTAQITFKLKSTVSNQNPSSDGLFEYGTIENGNFIPFTNYATDGSGDGTTTAQKGWTFNPGVESYPFLAFEQLTAYEVTPQPFPVFGIFMHPGDNPSVVRLKIPQNVTIQSIKNSVQRPTFGCGTNIGFSIYSSSTIILPRTIIETSNSPTNYDVLSSTTLSGGDYVYFVVDSGTDGNDWCDDTAVDVEITLKFDKINKPVITGSLNCDESSATYTVAFQNSGTLELYMVGNSIPIATTSIRQVGTTYNGSGTFSSLNLTNGTYYVIAKSDDQIESAQSVFQVLNNCCVQPTADVISVNELTLCAGKVGTLTATGCTGTVTWSNGFSGASTTVNAPGNYIATCTKTGTAPCTDAVSNAIGKVTVNALPTLTAGMGICAANLLTYSLPFTSNGIVTSDVGTISSNTVNLVLSGSDIVLTSTLNGCVVTSVITAPDCSCPSVGAPINGGDKSICQGETLPTLSVSVGAGETADWYSSSTGGTLLASASLTYTPTTAGTFYAVARNNTTQCVSSTRIAVVLTSKALPTLEVGARVCSSDLLTYSVAFTSSGTVTSSSGTVSGNTVVGVTAGQSGTLTSTLNGCVVTSVVTAPDCSCPTVTAPTNGGDKSICLGETLPALSVTVGSGETADWYSASTGGTLLASASLTYTPTAAGSFYVVARNITTQCISSTRTAVVLTSKALPTLEVGARVCSSDLLTYSVAFTSSGTVTSSSGTVSGNTVVGVTAGQSVTLTSTLNGCVVTSLVTAPDCSCPTVTAPTNGGDKSICLGETLPALSVTVGSGETADWYSASTGGTLLASASLTYTPTAAGSFYVVARNTTTQCVSSTRIAVSLNIKSLPILEVGARVCSSDLLTYSVAFTSSGTVTSSSGTVSGNTVVGVTAGQSVTLTSTLNGCVVTSVVTAPDCSCPTVTAPTNGGDKSICLGETLPALSVTVGSGETADWYSASTGGTLLASASLTYTPTTAGTFYAVARNATTQCISSTRTAITLNIKALPTLEVGTKACSSDLLTYSVAFTSSGTVTSSSGTVSGNTVVGVTAGQSVTLTSTLNGCVVTSVVTAPDCSCPSVAAPINGGDKSICQGETLPTLTVSVGVGETADWYSSSTGGTLLASASLTYTPTAAGAFYVVARNTTTQCISSTRTVVALTIKAVGTTPTINISQSIITLGESSTLTGSGCNGTYKWSNGSREQVLIVSPNATASYNLECINSSTCTGGVASTVITVLPPKVSIKSSNACLYETVRLIPEGCTQGISWVVYENDGTFKSHFVQGSLAVLLDGTKRIKLLCQSTAGESVDEITIVPYERPSTPFITANKTSYVSGEEIVLTSNNCNATTVWENGQTGNIFKQLAKVSKNYQVKCVSSMGCTSTASYDVWVKQAPPEVKDLTICEGESIVLSANCNASWNLNWTNGNERVVYSNGATITLYESNDFGVSCEGEAGISEMIVISVTVIPKPPVPKFALTSSVIVAGDSAIISVSNCTNVQWFLNNEVIEMGANFIKVSPKETTTYVARCKESGCWGDYDKVTVSVRPKKPLLKSSADTICLGETVKLTANCINSKLVWLNDTTYTQTTLELAPVKDSTFTFVCVSFDSLVSDTTIIPIKVYSIPTKPILTASKILLTEGERTELTAKGCNGVLKWNTGDKVETINVAPIRNTKYFVTCSNWKCSSDTSSLLIRIKPTTPIITSDNNKSSGTSITDSLCIDKTLQLSVNSNCENKLLWSTGAIGNSIIVTGKTTTTYTVYCESNDGEKSEVATANIVVFSYDISGAYVYPNPTVDKLYIQSQNCIGGVLLRLYTQRGVLVYEGPGDEHYLNSVVLNMHHLPSEIFILHIIGNVNNKPTTLQKRVVKANSN